MSALSDEMRERLSEAIDHVDQANAIFNYVLFSLQSFQGTSDPKWDHRLAAIVNTSAILSHLPGTDQGVIIEASEEIALRRLPRLLCISLVTAVETCLEDLMESHYRVSNPGASDEVVAKEVKKIVAGGPLQYLPRLANELSLPSLATPDWDWFTELVATRNILVHCAELTADARYVKNAGPDCRAIIGGQLPVDNTYLIPQYAECHVSLLNLLNAP